MSFPNTDIEALALLYLAKKTDFSDITPKELYQQYEDIREELSELKVKAVNSEINAQFDDEL